MLIYCEKTGKMIDPELRFQQSLKDAWAPLVMQHFLKVSRGNNSLATSQLTNYSKVKLNA